MNKAFYFIGAFLIVLLDQLSKWFVMEKMLAPKASFPSYSLIEWYTHSPDPLPYTKIELLPFFNLVMVWNKGISFGLFNDHSIWGPTILVGISLCITTVFTIWLLRSNIKTQNIAIALVIGGAIGNVIDRLRFGAVIDFLDVHIAGFHWPAFNIADSCIVIGVLLLVVFSFSSESKDAPTAEKAENLQTPAEN